MEEKGISGAAGGTAINDERIIQKVAASPWVEDEGGRRPRVIAVVGLSAKEDRPSYLVARELQRQGYRIVPVNPRYDEVLGEKAYKSLDDVPFPVDVVQVFRAPAYVTPVAEAAARRPEKPVFWMQEGVVSEEAAGIAAAAGLPVVMDRCLWREVQRLQAAGSLPLVVRREKR
ncbi:MAG: CoA-binding protein [Clostridia bacterium]